MIIYFKEVKKMSLFYKKESGSITNDSFLYKEKKTWETITPRFPFGGEKKHTEIVEKNLNQDEIISLAKAMIPIVSSIISAIFTAKINSTNSSLKSTDSYKRLH